MHPLLRITVVALCCAGFYVSRYMLAKTRRAARGELHEPSVVQRPAAKLYLGVPNALLAMIYYPSLAFAVWFASDGLWYVVFVPVAAAALTSAYLAYSLRFRTRMPCPYCWTSHAVNWLLALLLWQLR
jgi:uncharacterized membrane protein